MARLRVVFLLIAWVSAVAAFAIDTGYKITNYAERLQLRQDSTVVVTEELDVVFNEPRHGIYRDIPYSYQLADGNRRNIDVGQINVADKQFKVTRQGGQVRIRIGDPDSYEPTDQTVRYTITYVVNGAVNWFEGNSNWKPWAELYWNVVGPNWDTTIDRVSFTVEFPHEPGMQMRARVVSGDYGQNDGVTLTEQGTGSYAAQQLTVDLNDGEMSGSRSLQMQPGEALTVIVGVPASLVKQPPPIALFFTWLKHNLGILLPLIAAAILFPIWLLIGREPKLGPIGVRFEPPTGVDAAHTGVLIDNKVDGRDISAGIMSLAVKGHLKFVPGHKHGIFQTETAMIKTTDRTDRSNLSEFEKSLLDSLDPPFEITVDGLKNRLASPIPRLAKSLRRSLVENGYYRTHPEDVRAAVITPFIIGGFLLAFCGAGVLSSVLQYSDLGFNGLTTFIGIVTAIGVVVLFAYIMPARTALGVTKYREAAGFFEAMRGRSHYMDWFSKTNLDMAKYEEYLPYAVAFGLVNEWSRICGDVITGPPSFLETDRNISVWDIYWYNSFINHSISDMNHAVNAPLADSLRGSSASSGSSGFGGGSFGGGGFSGGGFGGGGGGSW